MTELEETRKLIDAIDKDLCHWLDFRLSLAEKVRTLKTMVEDTRREEEILKKIEYSNEYQNKNALMVIYQAIFDEMKKIQSKEINCSEYYVKYSGKNKNNGGAPFYAVKYFDDEASAVAGMHNLIDSDTSIDQAAVVDCHDRIIQSYTRGY